MANLRIQTTQNVEIDFPLASIGARILGGLIDFVILVLYAIFSNIVLINFFDLHIFESYNAMSWLGLFIIFFPTTFYSLFLEYFWNGQTIGKRIMGVRVIMADGSRLGVPQVALRWMFRLIDIYLMFPMPVVGVICMAATKKAQRLGDLVANTAVIKLKREVTLKDTIYRVVKDDYTPVFKNVLILSDKDIRIIKNTLEDYSRTRDGEKIKILGEKAKELLGIKKEVKYLPMLRTILKDYNYLATKENK